jgi:hypothetical protein
MWPEAPLFAHVGHFSLYEWHSSFEQNTISLSSLLQQQWGWEAFHPASVADKQMNIYKKSCQVLHTQKIRILNQCSSNNFCISAQTSWIVWSTTSFSLSHTTMCNLWEIILQSCISIGIVLCRFCEK